MMDLRANFEGECSEVGMYLAMSRVAHRKVILRLACTGPRLLEEAEHAAKFAELLGEVVTYSTKKNLEMRELLLRNGATARKFDLAKRAKALNLDAIHDTVHGWLRMRPATAKAFAGLLNRYFG